MKQYGIFSNSIERYLLLSKNSWATLHTAKILSSKFSTTVHELESLIDIVDKDCFFYGVKNTQIIKQESQCPSLIEVNDPIVFLGNPLDISKDVLISHKNFCNYAFKVVCSSWKTDAVLNKTNNKFFLNFYQSLSLSVTNDESTIDNGFLKSIDKILYFETSIKDCEEKINQLFLSNIRNDSLKSYKNLFFKEMNNFKHE
jgi:hypothetical protein